MTQSLLTIPSVISPVLSTLGHMQVMGVGLKADEGRLFEVLPAIQCRHEIGVCVSLHASVNPKGTQIVLSHWWQFVM